MNQELFTRWLTLALGASLVMSAAARESNADPRQYLDTAAGNTCGVITGLTAKRTSGLAWVAVALIALHGVGDGNVVRRSR